jgi:hypothetical protein
MDKLATAFLGAIGVLLVGILISFLLSWPVYWLWNNSLIGAVSIVHEITWLQAWGISILCSMLFKTDVNVNKD